MSPGEAVEIGRALAHLDDALDADELGLSDAARNRLLGKTAELLREIECDLIETQYRDYRKDT